MVGAAATAALRRVGQNLVGLCLQGELGLGECLILSFTKNGADAPRLFRNAPQTPSLGLWCPVADKCLYTQAAAGKEVLLLPALFAHDITLL